MLGTAASNEQNGKLRHRVESSKSPNQGIRVDLGLDIGSFFSHLEKGLSCSL